MLVLVMLALGPDLLSAYGQNVQLLKVSHAILQDPSFEGSLDGPSMWSSRGCRSDGLHLQVLQELETTSSNRTGWTCSALTSSRLACLSGDIELARWWLGASS